MDSGDLFEGNRKEANHLILDVNTRFGLHPIFKINQKIKVDEYQPYKSYECKIDVGDEQFPCVIHKQQKVHQSEDVAVKISTDSVTTKMAKPNFKLHTNKHKKDAKEKEKVILDNSHKIPGVELSEGCASLKNFGTDGFNAVYECVKYMSDEVLAMQFKDIVNYVVKKYSTATPHYTTKLCQDGDFPGYTSELEFKGRKFESIGLMVDEYQAEQSAAEDCLRSLQFIPYLSRENYLIQPYQGGVSRHIDGLSDANQCLFTNTVYFDLLDAFLASRHMLKPKFYAKISETNSNVNEFNVYGEPERKFDGLIAFSGKVFKVPSPQVLRISMQLAANTALNYFGISCPVQRMELRKHIRINRYDFWNYWALLFLRRPSVLKVWIMDKFCSPDKYEDTGVEELRKSKIIMNNLPDEEYILELVTKEMERNPAFKCQDLMEMDDLSVAAVDISNPNLFTIGNTQFSIKVLIEGGQLYSHHRQTTVDVLPGHNILKLRCEYRVSLPSLEIHLKAIDCHDLRSSNPPLPVVTSCGIAVLYHDHVASPEDVYVLVKRRHSDNSFESKVRSLQLLLHSLILPNLDITITAADCTKGINNWCYKELKLLSDMTMDSLQELMSTHVEYDLRWNELFAKSELDTPLKELQDICLYELKRREENNITDEDIIKIPWELPQSEFVSRFDEIGIHLEDSMFCGVRALVSCTGIKLDLSDIEDSLIVDIPRESNERHQGGLSRFYIKVSRNEGKPPPGTKDHPDLEGYPMTNRPIDHGMTRIEYSRRAGIFTPTFRVAEQHRLMQNVEYVNEDGSRTKYVDYKINEKIEQDLIKASQKKAHIDRGINPVNSAVQDNDDKDVEMSEPPIESSDNVITNVIEVFEENGGLDMSRLPGKPPYTAYLANLPSDITEDDIRSLFKDFKIEDIRFHENKEKRSGYVDFTDIKQLLSAIELNNEKIRSCQVRIKIANWATTGKLNKALDEIPMPPDEKFMTYKDSLAKHCYVMCFPPPKYNIEKVGKKTYRGSVLCDKMNFKVKGMAKTNSQAENLAAAEALHHFGHLQGMEVPMLGDKKKFISFKDSLSKYCLTKYLLPPKYSSVKEGKQFRGFVSCSNMKISAKETARSAALAETHAAVSALRHFGFLIDTSLPHFLTTDDKKDVVMNEPPMESSDGVITEEVKEGKHVGAVSEPSVESSGGVITGHIKGLDNVPMPGDAEFVSFEDSLAKCCQLKNLAPPDYTNKAGNEERKRFFITVRCGKKTFRGKKNTYSGAKQNAAVQALRHFGYLKGNQKKLKVVNEKINDECAQLENKTLTDVKKPKVNEWINDEDIQLDELDNPPEEDVIGKIGEKRKSMGNKKIKSGDEDLGEKKKMGEAFNKCNGTPDISWVNNKNTKEVKEWTESYRAPVLPATDTYREQCMWMKIDEAIDVCPDLMKISQTEQFQKQLSLLVEKANIFLKTTNLPGTVRTTLLPST